MTDSESRETPADGYAAALAELQKILDALEAPDVDVDALAGHVDRAAELLRFCRERLVAAETQVTQIVAGLEDLAPDAVTTDGTAREDDDAPGGPAGESGG